MCVCSGVKWNTENRRGEQDKKVTIVLSTERGSWISSDFYFLYFSKLKKKKHVYYFCKQKTKLFFKPRPSRRGQLVCHVLSGAMMSPGVRLAGSQQCRCLRPCNSSRAERRPACLLPAAGPGEQNGPAASTPARAAPGAFTTQLLQLGFSSS